MCFFDTSNRCSIHNFEGEECGADEWKIRCTNRPSHLTQILLFLHAEISHILTGCSCTLKSLTCSFFRARRADGFRNGRAGTRERSSRVCRSLGELVLFAWSPRLSNVLILHVHAHNTREQSKHIEHVQSCLGFTRYLDWLFLSNYVSRNITHIHTNRPHSHTHHPTHIANRTRVARISRANF